MLAWPIPALCSSDSKGMLSALSLLVTHVTVDLYYDVGVMSTDVTPERSTCGHSARKRVEIFTEALRSQQTELRRTIVLPEPEFSVS